MIFAVALVLFLGFGRAASAWNEPTGFKGVPFGASEESIRQKLPSFECRPSVLPASPERSCSGVTDIGPVRDVVYFHFRAGKLCQITINFEREHFDVMAAGFIERYGNPTSSDDTPFRLEDGRTVPNRILQWKGQRMHVSIVKRWNRRPDISHAEITTVQELKEQAEALRRIGKGVAEDL